MNHSPLARAAQIIFPSLDLLGDNLKKLTVFFTALCVLLILSAYSLAGGKEAVWALINSPVESFNKNYFSIIVDDNSEFTSVVSPLHFGGCV